MRFIPMFTRSTARLAHAAALALALTACTRSVPTAEPAATLMAAPWTSVPVTAEPTVDASVMATMPTVADAPAGGAVATMDVVAFATQLSATIAALASPAPTTAPRVAVNTAVPIAGCTVPKVPSSVTVRMDADQPSPAERWWYAEDPSPRQFEGEVVSQEGGGTSTRVNVSGDDRSSMVTISIDVPVQLPVGRHVRVIWHDERPRTGPGGHGVGIASYGLFIADDDGPAALIVASTSPPAASERLLAGERGGFTVQQLRSPCAIGDNVCGFSLHAAPATFARGAASITIGPGEAGALAPSGGVGPAYGVRLATSHVRVGDGTAGCVDPASWLFSYSIVRQ